MSSASCSSSARQSSGATAGRSTNFEKPGLDPGGDRRPAAPTGRPGPARRRRRPSPGPPWPRGRRRAAGRGHRRCSCRSALARSSGRARRRLPRPPPCRRRASSRVEAAAQPAVAQAPDPPQRRCAPAAHPDLQRILERRHGRRGAVDRPPAHRSRSAAMVGTERATPVTARQPLSGSLGRVVEPEHRRDEQPATGEAVELGERPGEPDDVAPGRIRWVPSFSRCDPRRGKGQADERVERRAEEGLRQPDRVEAEPVEVVDDLAELVDRAATVPPPDGDPDAHLHAPASQRRPLARRPPAEVATRRSAAHDRFR